MKKVVITIEFDEASYEVIDRALRDGIIGLDATDVSDYLLHELLANLDYDGFDYLRGESEVGDA